MMKAPLRPGTRPVGAAQRAVKVLTLLTYLLLTYSSSIIFQNVLVRGSTLLARCPGTIDTATHRAPLTVDRDARRDRISGTTHAHRPVASSAASAAAVCALVQSGGQRRWRSLPRQQRELRRLGRRRRVCGQPRVHARGVPAVLQAVHGTCQWRCSGAAAQAAGAGGLLRRGGLRLCGEGEGGRLRLRQGRDAAAVPPVVQRLPLPEHHRRGLRLRRQAPDVQVVGERRPCTIT